MKKTKSATGWAYINKKTGAICDWAMPTQDIDFFLLMAAGTKAAREKNIDYPGKDYKVVPVKISLIIKKAKKK